MSRRATWSWNWHRVALVLLALSLLGNALAVLGPLCVLLRASLLRSKYADVSRLSSGSVSVPPARRAGKSLLGSGDGNARPRASASLHSLPSKVCLRKLYYPFH